jgi:hypothetical protein
MKTCARIIICITSALLISCGGGGSSSSSTGSASSTTLSGTVASGAPVPNATVVITDADGKTLTFTTDSQGGYSNVDISGLRKPLVITASGAVGTQEVSLVSVMPASESTGNQTANVTTLTTALAGLINSNNSYNAAGVTPSTVTATNVDAANQALVAAIAPVLKDASLSASTFNPITSPLTANHLGHDQVLDTVGIAVTSTGIVLNNKTEPLADSANATNITLTKVGTSGTLPTGTLPFGSALAQLEVNMRNCLKQSASSRATNPVTDVGGNVSVALANISADCKSYIDSRYLHSSYAYGERWGAILNSENYSGTSIKVSVAPLYVVNNPAIYPGSGDAYVVNVNYTDVNGLWYTKVELLTRATIGGVDTFTLFGNQRALDFGVDANFTYIDDQGTPANNRVEGRIRINTTTHRAKLPGQSAAKYYFDSTNKADPKMICAWVTGPFLQADAAAQSDGAPIGGILLKLVDPAVTDSRNYLAIAAKYSTDFDPVNNSGDQKILYDDCIAKSISGGPTNSTASTFGINSQFTINGYKANSAATWAYVNSAGTEVTRSNISTCVTGNCPRKSNVTFKSIAVTDAEQLAYKNIYGDASRARYKAYLFMDNSYTNSNGALSWANQTAFWSSATVVAGRITGGMPFVSNTSGVYANDVKFRTINPSVIAQYLGATPMTTIASGTALSLAWTVPDGAQGVDSISGAARGLCLSGGSYYILPSVVDSVSKGVSRAALSGVLTTGDRWIGSDLLNTNQGSHPVCTNPVVRQVYRELTTKSYDMQNRQIQYVANRTISN